MKPLTRIITAAACALALTAPLALAQSQPSDEDGRFLLRKTENGWFRVDQNTGQASLCQRGGSGFTCELVPDDRNALLDEITRLAEENAMLRGRLARADVADEPAPDATPQPRENDGLNLPSEEEVDELMSRFRIMLDRFLAMVQDLHQEFSQDEQTQQ